MQPLAKLAPHGVTIFRQRCSGLGSQKGGMCPPSASHNQRKGNPMERHHVHNLTISKRGLQFIRSKEGLRLIAYKDGGGVWTIGYGHTETVFPKMQITEAQAESLLRNDLFKFEKAVRDLVDVPLSQNEYDAIVSFVFNIGVNQFIQSTFLRKLNNLQYDEAADQLLRWVYDNGKLVPGLQNRRRDERLFFLGHGGMGVDVLSPGKASCLPGEG